MSDSKLQKGKITRYSNQLGLYDQDRKEFISNSGQVVINFPFKDCVLEGGMTKEDVGRDERYLCEMCDKADIDTLFEPKVLTNFEYIDRTGERKLTDQDEIEFFDEKGELKQNLLIKGNNLLALHSLKKRLAGQVKLIYIDPPFYFPENKPQDSFKYNSNFKLSSWLVFMRNRLEIAKDLLSDKGSIFIHIDWNGVHYLKLILEDVFGQNNYQTQITLRREVTRGRKSESKFFGHNADYILVFSKTSLAEFYPVSIEEEITSDKLSKIKHDEMGYFTDSDPGTYSDESLIDLYDQNRIFITKNGKAIIDRDNKTFSVTAGSPRIKYYLIEKDNKYYKTKFIDDIWTDISGIASSSGERVGFPSQKTEQLVNRILMAVTTPNEIVLDFCLGSGTTAAVAHKMGRRWIGIEQMDYIEDISKVRLQKVIVGEQGGISQAVNWQGGGSFVYLELKKYNQRIVDLIWASTSKEQLKEVYKEIKQNAFVNFWFDHKAFEKEEEWTKLPLEEQKGLLIKLIDENQLYLNLLDMDDTTHEVSETEKVLTRRFYGEK